MRLSEYLDVIGYDIAMWMASFEEHDFPVEQLGDVFVDVTTKLRSAAIIVLLTKGNVDAWHHNLIRSANCRLKYLSRLTAAGILDDHHQASARVGPFLDAVAAEQFAIARQIVTVSPRHWMRDHEYEDDHLHAQMLHALIAPVFDLNAMLRMAERYEQVLAGASDARLDVVRALALRSQEDFDVAFDRLIARRSAAIEAEKARHRIEEPSLLAERQVFVEGLAILQIAGRLRLATRPEYEYCPSLARRAMRSPFIE